MPRRSRLKLPKAAYKKLCDQVHQRDGWKCRIPYCKKRSNLHAHHIVYRSQGGDDASWNLLTVCNDCHDAIHSRFVIVLAVTKNPDDTVNADDGVKFLFVGGWRPKR